MVLIIIEWRHATVYRAAAAEDAVDKALKADLISKKCKGATIENGQKLSADEIRQLKDSGLYHNLFSSKGRVVVQELVKEASTLKIAVASWISMVIEACFHPANEAGVRVPIEINGKKLAAAPEVILKHGTNALKRMLNCIPPPDMPAWAPTGEVEHNGFRLWKSRFHTCGCESSHSTQPDFANARASKELAQGSFLEGNTPRLVRMC